MAKFVSKIFLLALITILLNISFAEETKSITGDCKKRCERTYPPHTYPKVSSLSFEPNHKTCSFFFLFVYKQWRQFLDTKLTFSKTGNTAWKFIIWIVCLMFLLCVFLTERDAFGLFKRLSFVGHWPAFIIEPKQRKRYEDLCCR